MYGDAGWWTIELHQFLWGEYLDLEPIRLLRSTGAAVVYLVANE